MLLFGGVLYLTAAGNEDQTGRSKRLMLDALVGLVIILGSYGVGIWILRTLGFGIGEGGAAGGQTSITRPQQGSATFEFTVRDNQQRGVSGATLLFDGNTTRQLTSSRQTITLSQLGARQVTVQHTNFVTCTRSVFFSSDKTFITIQLHPQNESECRMTPGDQRQTLNSGSTTTSSGTLPQTTPSNPEYGNTTINGNVYKLIMPSIGGNYQNETDKVKIDKFVADCQSSQKVGDKSEAIAGKINVIDVENNDTQKFYQCVDPRPLTLGSSTTQN